MIRFFPSGKFFLRNLIWIFLDVLSLKGTQVDFVCFNVCISEAAASHVFLDVSHWSKIPIMTSNQAVV